jgi:hypothetical protein
MVKTPGSMPTVVREHSELPVSAIQLSAVVYLRSEESCLCAVEGGVKAIYHII